MTLIGKIIFLTSQFSHTHCNVFPFRNKQNKTRQSKCEYYFHFDSYYFSKTFFKGLFFYCSNITTRVRRKTISYLVLFVFSEWIISKLCLIINNLNTFLLFLCCFACVVTSEFFPLIIPSFFIQKKRIWYLYISTS